MRKDLLRVPHGPDRDIIARSREAYRASDLPVAEEKGFGFSAPPTDGLPHCGAEEFLAWGTEIHSELG